MRQALTGWIVAAACFVLAGAGAVVGAARSRGGEVSPAVVASWREYAEMVRQGKRTPLPATTQLLTETAIAQNAYAGVRGPAPSHCGCGRGDRRTAATPRPAAPPLAPQLLHRHRIVPHPVGDAPSRSDCRRRTMRYVPEFRSDRSCPAS